MDTLYSLITLCLVTLFIISSALFAYVHMLPRSDNRLKARSYYYFKLFIVFITLAFFTFTLQYFGWDEFSVLVDNSFMLLAACCILNAIFLRYEIRLFKSFWYVSMLTAMGLGITQHHLYTHGASLYYRDMVLFAVLSVPIFGIIWKLKQEISKQRIAEKSIFYTAVSFAIFIAMFVMLYALNLLEGEIAAIVFYFLAVVLVLTTTFIGFTLSIIQSLLGKLRQQAFTDKLTGAANRQQFYQSMNKMLARLKRYGTSSSIILCDIDFFKNINDTHGHIVGDKVLVDFVSLVQEQLRGEDALFRIGGEEFVIICEGASLDEAKHIAERLRDNVASLEIRFELTKINITASFGVASLDPTIDADANVHQADLKLYRAKTLGRNQVC